MEHDLFQHAPRWKTYLASILRPFIQGSVLEVGAGLGATTPFLLNLSVRRWLCLEPDPERLRALGEKIEAKALPPCCCARPGTILSLPPEPAFHTILYVDVLGFIERDRAELENAARLLHPGGRLIVLEPAHAWLRTAPDESEGRLRRYTLGSLLSLASLPLVGDLSCYLDSAGLLAAAAGRLLGAKGRPTRRQILLWDRCLVPVSRILDRMLGYRLGRWALAVWSSSRIEARLRARAEEDDAGEGIPEVLEEAEPAP